MDELAKKIVASGFKWVPMQGEENSLQVIELMGRILRPDGILVGAWEAAVETYSPQKYNGVADFYIGQIEGPHQADNVVEGIIGFTGKKAIVTNFGGLTPDHAKALQAHNVACIVECFPPEHTPVVQLTAAEQMGWPHATPMLGRDHWDALPYYPGASIWSAEYYYRS